MRHFLKKIAKGFPSVLLTLALAGGVTSCHHKDLEYPDASRVRLDVVFDWRNAPDADPSAMAFYVYNLDATTPIRFIFQNSTGGEIHIPSGDYLAMCLNADLTDWAVIEKEENMNDYKVSNLDDTSLISM